MRFPSESRNEITIDDFFFFFLMDSVEFTYDKIWTDLEHDHKTNPGVSPLKFRYYEIFRLLSVEENSSLSIRENIRAVRACIYLKEGKRVKLER